MAETKTPSTIEQALELALRLTTEDLDDLIELLRSHLDARSNPPTHWQVEEARAALEEFRREPQSAIPLEDAMRELRELVDNRRAKSA